MVFNALVPEKKITMQTSERSAEAEKQAGSGLLQTTEKPPWEPL